MKKKLIPAVCETNLFKRPFSVEEQIDIQRKNTRKFSRRDTVKIILSFLERNVITDIDREIFNKILGDTKILDKIQICNDGSYLNGRIYYKLDINGPSNNSNIIVDGDYWYRSSIQPDIITKLNFMKNNFEVIYLQCISHFRSFFELRMHEFIPSCPDHEIITHVSFERNYKKVT